MASIDVPNRWRHQLRLACIVGLPSLAVFGGIVLMRLIYGMPIGYFTRDPADILRNESVDHLPFVDDGVVHLPVYLGLVSYLGILMWCATATICFLTAVAVREPRQAMQRGFFYLAGALSTLLLLDDLFRLHEVVFPVYLGLHEYVLYATYAVSVLVLLIGFRQVVAHTDYFLLLLSGACLGLSAGSDVLTDTILKSIHHGMLLEDGLKFLGIVAWFTYFTRTSLDYLRR